MGYSYLNDKYFTSLDDFNKDLIAHKSNFYRDSQGFNFYEYLNFLSFNLDFNSKNYRWGKRYFNKELKDFCWITSNDKKQISKYSWDTNEHCYKNKDINAYFTNDDIQSHFLSCFKSNRKIGFFYKLSLQEKLELGNYSTALENMFKVSDKTFGSSQKIGSDILLIDIDNYEDRHSLETLSMLLDILKIKTSDLMFIEQNAFTGGIHTALRLPHPITNVDFYPLLMKKLQEEDVRIECNFINTILRFPLSFEYVAIKKDESIFNYDEFIPSSLWEKTFIDYLNNLNDNICNSDYLNNLIHETHMKEETYDKWKNYWKIKKHLFKRTKEVKLKNYSIYNIERGKRYESMSKIVPYSKMIGHSLDETVDLIFEHNINSKDLAKWTKEKLKRNIEKFYNKCPDQVCSTIKASNISFVSNLKNLPSVTQQFLNNKEFGKWFTDRFIECYMKERNKHNNGFKSFSQEKLDILYRQIPYLLKEIIGKMFYDVNSDKEFINSSYNNLLGFQLSDSHLKAIQEQSIIDLGIDSPLAKTSLQYLKKALLSALKVKEIKYNNRKRNWMLGSCKSFNVKSMNDLYSLLNSLYNRCFNKLYKNRNNFNSDIYNLLILYISLVENYDILDVDTQNKIQEMLSKYQT